MLSSYSTSQNPAFTSIHSLLLLIQDILFHIVFMAKFSRRIYYSAETCLWYCIRDGVCARARSCLLSKLQPSLMQPLLRRLVFDVPHLPEHNKLALKVVNIHTL